MTIPGKIPFYLASGIPIIGIICGAGAEVIKNLRVVLFAIQEIT